MSILDAIIPILVAFILYLLGQRAYFMQKEYEHRRKRYFDDCLDELIAQTEHALQIFRHNWGKALSLHKQIRDLDRSAQINTKVDHFSEIDPSAFSISPSKRFGTLIQDKSFWAIQQKLFGFTRNASQFFSADYYGFIRFYLKGNEPTKPVKEILDDYWKDMLDLNSESYQYYVLLEEYENLASALESHKLTKDVIGQFHKEQVVKDSIKKIRRAFEEYFIWLEESELPTR